MAELQFVKNGKEFKVLIENKEVGKMFKDNLRNYQFAIVVKWNFKVKGYRNEVSGRTYKEVKVKAQKMYNELMELVERGKELINIEE